MGSGTKTRDETQSELEILRARVAQLEHERDMRVQVQEALREQRDLLDSIIEGTDDLVFAKDLEGRYVLMNSADAKGFGKAVDEVVGLTDRDLFPPDQAKRVMETDRQIIATGKSMAYEQNFGRSAHGTRTYLVYKYPRFDRDGRVIGVLGIARDITDRKRAEETLRKSELEKSLILNAASEHIVHQDTEHTIVRANRAAAASVGQKPEDLTGRKCYEIWHHRQKPCEDCPIDRALETRKPAQGEMITPDGRAWLIRGTPVRNESGAVIGAIEVTLEITERRRAEEELRESEQRFRQIAENSGQVFWLTDWRAKKLLYVNPTYETIYAQSIESLYEDRRSWLEVVHPEDRLRVDQAFAQKGEHGDYTEEEYRIVRPDDSVRWIRDRSLPIRDADGNVYRYIGIAEDITERKRAEEELAKYRDHLEELVEQRTRELDASREQLRRAERLASIGTLAAGIAHEINNPVGMILLAAENAKTCQGQPNTQSRLDKCLDNIVESAERCGDITEGVLRFAKPQTTDKAPANLIAILEHAVLLTRKYLKERGGMIELQPAPDLPQVLVNTVEMEQVFINLIRNAVEAAVGKVRIVIRVQAGPQGVRIVVQDDGPGVAEDDLEHLFDPFFTTHREKGGTGLGLSIVHGIITGHGGSVGAESCPGKGSTFAIELPAISPREAEAENAEGADC